MISRRVLTWVIFWVSVVLALSALAWVSVEVVELERREAESRTQATREESIRRALWRLDSTMAPVLAVEAARPSSAYITHEIERPEIGDDRISSVSDSLSDGYARRYFNLDYSDENTDEIALLQQRTQVQDSEPLDAAASVQEDETPMLEALKSSKQAESDYDARSRIAQSVTQNAAPARALNEQSRSAERFDQRMLESESAEEGLAFGLRLNSTDTREDSAFGVPYSDQASVLGQQSGFGTLTPRWIQSGGERKLVLVRDAFVDGRPVVQGVELDWEQLRADLLRSISDVLPGAALAPSSTQSLGAYRMATIPVVLIPPSIGSMPVWAWSPARVGLVVTWIAIIATIVAVGIVLRAAIVLSERRGRFVSAVTHELRTPLTTFRLYSQMLADGMVSDDQVRRDYLSTLKRESERLTGIVENVLEYARLSRSRSGRTKPEGEQSLSPGALVARFRPALARRLGQHNMDLVASLDLDGHQERTVTVDPHAVERVMMNLIENACKYAAPGEDEQESEEHDTRVHLDVGVNEGMLELLIADHGPGIEPNERSRIFGEFQRGRRGLGNARSGLGLGLALSRGLAREMGGDLELVRRRGHGAEFLLTVPLDQPG